MVGLHMESISEAEELIRAYSDFLESLSCNPASWPLDLRKNFPRFRFRDSLSKEEELARLETLSPSLELSSRLSMSTERLRE